MSGEGQPPGLNPLLGTPQPSGTNRMAPHLPVPMGLSGGCAAGGPLDDFVAGGGKPVHDA